MTTDNASGAGMERIRQALEAGPTSLKEWRAVNNEVHIGTRRICSHVNAGESLPMGEDHARSCINAQWIAACNPAAIRALIDAHDDATALLAEKAQRIERLEAANAALLDQMHHFANADQRLWDEGMRDAESFKSWVRSRAAHLLAKFNAPPAALSQPHPHGG